MQPHPIHPSVSWFTRTFCTREAHGGRELRGGVWCDSRRTGAPTADADKPTKKPRNPKRWLEKRLKSAGEAASSQLASAFHRKDPGGPGGEGECSYPQAPIVCTLTHFPPPSISSSAGTAGLRVSRSPLEQY
jgi:hypothetical protein